MIYTCTHMQVRVKLGVRAAIEVKGLGNSKPNSDMITGQCPI